MDGKIFNYQYEKDIVRDVINSLLRDDVKSEDLFIK